MFDSKVFLEKMYRIEKKTCDILGLFSAPSESAPGALSPPCPPRYVPGVTLRDKVRSCEICRALNVEPLVRIKISQLRLFGHVSRTPYKRLARQALLAKPTAKRPRGRPRPRWSDCISDIAWSHLGVESLELSEIAVDRDIFQVLLGMLPPATLPRG